MDGLAPKGHLDGCLLVCGPPYLPMGSGDTVADHGSQVRQMAGHKGSGTWSYKVTGLAVRRPFSSSGCATT